MLLGTWASETHLLSMGFHDFNFQTFKIPNIGIFINHWKKICQFSVSPALNPSNVDGTGGISLVATPGNFL